MPIFPEQYVRLRLHPRERGPHIAGEHRELIACRCRRTRRDRAGRARARRARHRASRLATASQSECERRYEWSSNTAPARLRRGVQTAASVTPSSVRIETSAAAACAARTTSRTGSQRRRAARESCDGLAFEGRQVLADDAIEADEDRAADDGMTDRHLVEVRHPAEDREVVEIEVVAGVDAKPAIGRAPSRRDVSLEAARSARRRPSRRPARTARYRAPRGRRPSRQPSPRRRTRDRRTGSRARRAPAGPTPPRASRLPACRRASRPGS